MNDTPSTADLDDAFKSLWRNLGVTPEDMRCPRRCGWALRIDWKYQSFSCRECRYSGRGIVDLVRLRDRISDPHRELDHCDDDLSTAQCPSPFLQLLANGHRLRLVRRPCKRLSCTYCGPLGRQLWVARLGPKLDAQPVFHATGTGAEWSSVYKAIQRAGGDYVRLPREGGWTLFTTTQVKGSTAVPLGEARMRFDMAIHHSSQWGNRSASKAWRESTVAEESSQEAHELLTEILGDRDDWRVLSYRCLRRVTRETARLGIEIPGVDQIRRIFEWDRPEDHDAYREYLYSAGIVDPDVPPYSNFGAWLDAA